MHGALVHLALRVGPTYDEHFYVAAGHAYLRDGDFALNREHPPLVKYLVGAPLFLLDLDWPERWRDLIAYPATLGRPSWWPIYSFECRTISKITPLCSPLKRLAYWDFGTKLSPGRSSVKR